MTPPASREALLEALERLSIALMNGNIEPRWPVTEAFKAVQDAALATPPLTEGERIIGPTGAGRAMTDPLHALQAVRNRLHNLDPERRDPALTQAIAIVDEEARAVIIAETRR